MWKTRYTSTSNKEEVKMAHRSEQGNVLGFVLVGALLVAVLLGGIFVVRHNIANQSDNGSSVASNEAEDSDTASNDSTDKSGSSSDVSDKDKNTPAESNQSLKDTLDAQNSANRSGSSTDAANQGSTGHDADTLPETGPADTAFAVVGATLLVGAGVAYIGSRRLI